MQIIANRMELLSAAQNAAQIVPAQTALDCLRCACFVTENGKLTVTAGNLEITLERHIPAEIQEEGCVVIDAALLASMLRLMRGESVTIRQQGRKEVVISCGATSYTITVPDVSEYPRVEIPFPEDTVTVSGIPAIAKRTAFAVLKADESKPELQCVHLVFSENGLHAVSSDGYRLASAKGDESASGSVDMLLPARSLEKLAQLVSNKDSLRVGTTGRSIVFFREDFIFSARLVEGRYLDTDKLLERVKPCFTVLTDAEALRKALASLDAFMSGQNRFSLSFRGSRLRMKCESEFGASCVETDVVPLSGTPEGEYWYNPQKLLECLRAQNGTMMLELAQNGILLMQTDELTCLQTATREPKPIELRSREPKAGAAEPPEPAKRRKSKKEDAARKEAA